MRESKIVASIIVWYGGLTDRQDVASDCVGCLNLLSAGSHGIGLIRSLMIRRSMRFGVRREADVRSAGDVVANARFHVITTDNLL